MNSTAKAEQSTPDGDSQCKEIGSTDDSVNIEPKLSGIGLVLVLVAIYLSILCVALDNTIIATAVPRITDQFHSIDDVGWYGSAYLICEAAFQPFFGKVYTAFELKYVYLAALMIFEIGSAVCASAPISAIFILGRAIAGVGSAGIFSGVALIIGRNVPLSQRPIYFGAFSAMYGLAASAGPIVGGALTTYVSWRWCFYINLPMGAITLAFVTLVYTPRGSHRQRDDCDSPGWKAKLANLDYLGTAFFLPAIVCLLLALQWGGTTYPWNDWRIILVLTLFGILLIAFCLTQWKRQEKATIPPRILRKRSVASAACFGFCTVGSMFSMVYFLPIWFQAIKDVNPEQSGIRTIALTLALIITSMTTGIVIATLVGYYNPFMLVSPVLASIGAGMLSLLKVGSPVATWIGFEILFGIGIGFGMQQSLIVVQTVLPDSETPIGTALINFAQTLGGAVSISVASNIFDNGLRRELREAVPSLNADELVAAGATRIRDLVPAVSLSDVVLAYNNALVHTFRVPMVLAALSVLGALALEWRSVKKGKS